MRFVILVLIGGCGCLTDRAATAGELPETPRIDNFVISTRPIGPVVCPRNPVLIKTPCRGPGKQQGWKVDIAADESGKTVVWRSTVLTDPQRLVVGPETGQFLGPLAGNDRLAASQLYYVRIMQRSDDGRDSVWSPWHQPFKTEDEAK